MPAEFLDTDLLRKRDVETWDALYSAVCGRTYRVLCHVTGAKPLVLDELNQDVWLSAIESIERFDATRGSVHDWVLGIARYKGLTYLRQHYTNRLAFVGSGKELPQPWTDAVAEGNSHESKAERIALLRASIESLPENWQFVLRQKYDKGLSIKEISELVGLTPKAVESMLSRARQRLRELYQDTFERNENS